MDARISTFIIYEDPQLLEIVEGMIGYDPIMCQFATVTSLIGSLYEPIT